MLPTRSGCHCSCHSSHAVHIMACCQPDVKPFIFDLEQIDQKLEVQEQLVPCKGCDVLIRKVPGLPNVCAECLKK
jgi:hypothetical protein